MRLGPGPARRRACRSTRRTGRRGRRRSCRRRRRRSGSPRRRRGRGVRRTARRGRTAWSWPARSGGRRPGARRTPGRRTAAPSTPAGAPRRPPPARTAADERPLASAAPWRASAIDGRVSPTTLNSPYMSCSPGIERVITPGCPQRIGEDRPARAGEQGAVEVEEGSAGGHGPQRKPCSSAGAPDARPSGAPVSVRTRPRKTGKAPLGGSGASQPGTLRMGDPLGGLSSSRLLGDAGLRSTCESMHVNRVIVQAVCRDS